MQSYIFKFLQMKKTAIITEQSNALLPYQYDCLKHVKEGWLNYWQSTSQRDIHGEDIHSYQQQILRKYIQNIHN